MAKQKAKQLRDMSDKALQTKLSELQESLRSGRFLGSQGDYKPSERRMARKQIAQIMTILTEKQEASASVDKIA